MRRGGSAAIAGLQASHGTTAYLATLCTAARYHPHARVLKSAMQNPSGGAQQLVSIWKGVFQHEYRRVHPLQYVRVYTQSELDEALRASGDTLRLFTLAPEMPQAIEFIHILRQQGIVAAIGHTGASYDEAMCGIDAGISYATHAFAAMTPLHHREPGASGAALMDERVTVEILSDNLHLHPQIVRLAWKMKGLERMLLATDAMAGAGLPDGEYLLAGQQVRVQAGRTISPEGRIAGSTASMDMVVRNAHEWLGISIPQVMRLASFNPARVLGMQDRKGSIEIGKDADLMLCDRKFNPWMTVVRGKIEYQNQER